MGEKEWDPASVFDLFGDALARRILVLASEGPLSADDLASNLDASLPTVYRRVNALQEYDLITEHQQIDADGNHYTVFETSLKRITFEIEDGGYDVDIRIRQNLVDQFEGFWSELGESSGDRSRGDRASDHTRSREDPHHG